MQNTLTLTDGSLVKLTEAEFWTIIRALEMAATDADRAADQLKTVEPELSLREEVRNAAKDYRALASKLQGGE